MRKLIKEQYKTLLVVAALVFVMINEAFVAPTRVAVSASDTRNRYDNPTEVTVEIAPDPYAESKKIAEEQQQAIQEEGTKAENQTVAGEKSGANGLYLANKVKGVAVDPNNSNQNASALYIETLDTDAKKSSAAMASIEEAAKSGGPIINGEHTEAEVGPVVDVYFKKTENGKMVDGTANDVDFIKIGIPDNFKEEGYIYGYVIVFPGGRVYKETSWNQSGLGTDYIRVNMVDIDYREPVDYSQATIAITRYKDPYAVIDAKKSEDG